MDERELLRALAQAQPARLVLATVVDTRGSTPRGVGSRMLIDPSAPAGAGLLGTIGGGCGEADVLAAAREVLAAGRARLLRVELTEPIESWSPAVCGGTMDVLVEPVDGQQSTGAGHDGVAAV